MNKRTVLFRDRPLFGLDIAPGSVQLMQLKRQSTHLNVVGYAQATIDPRAIKEGVVADPQGVASTIKDLLSKGVVGDINSRRVAIAIPASRTFSRAVTLPKLDGKELHDAIMLETEQYTPVAIDNLYVDYTPIHNNKTQANNEYFIVAAPKQVVDSYLEVVSLLDLEPVIVETHVDSTRRLFAMTEFGTIPSVVIDIHGDSADISIVENNLIATGAVGLVNRDPLLRPQAAAPPQIAGQNDSQLELLLKEVRRMIRYYQERYDKTRRIEQIVLIGNEDVLPGLAGKMTDQLRLPVHSSDPWRFFSFDSHVTPIPIESRDDFMVAAGLAAIPFKQVLT